MSDIYIETTPPNVDVVISNDKLKTTSALSNSVYLSLFVPPYWGNAIEDADGRYTSTIPELITGTVTNQTRLDMIAAAKNALQWLVDGGYARSVDVRAAIATRSRINLAVTIVQPDATSETFTYAVNWDAQEAAL